MRRNSHNGRREESKRRKNDYRPNASVQEAYRRIGERLVRAFLCAQKKKVCSDERRCEKAEREHRKQREKSGGYVAQRAVGGAQKVGIQQGSARVTLLQRLRGLDGRGRCGDFPRCGRGGFFVFCAGVFSRQFAEEGMPAFGAEFRALREELAALAAVLSVAPMRAALGAEVALELRSAVQAFVHCGISLK